MSNATKKAVGDLLGTSQEESLILNQSRNEIEGSDENCDLGDGNEDALGTVATPSRAKATGHLDLDSFSINDVVLRIPPSEMRVEKQAFNHEWLTLRTRSSQKAKSGYSLSRISFSVEFKSGADFANLAQLIAGLRATPFCVVYSTYLDQVLGRNEHGLPPFIDRKSTSYNYFQPIMLALSSMVFSTLGHEAKPDCIRGTFEFWHFNYLPLTDIIAFKCGSGLDVPGTVWESLMWKKFYGPYIFSAPEWPHRPGILDIYNNRTTTFSWNEFVMLPKGDSAVQEAALTLVKSIKQGEEFTIASLNNLVTQTSSGKPTDQKALQNIWNTFYEKLVQGGKIPAGTTAWALGDPQAEELTGLMNDLLGPTLKRINATQTITQYDKRQLEQIELLLAERLKSIKNAQSQGEAAKAAMAQGGFDRLMEIPITVNKKDDPLSSTSTKIDVGGRDLYRRRATYNIRHQSTSDYEDGPQVIIQHITVGFRNNLAVIPMVGYRFPLIQHVGATDITVSLTMNVRNTAMGEGSSGLEAINRIYDTVLLMAQKFKQIPQGFTTLYIKNDFFQLFGLDEFIPERMSSETVPGMPGRSLVSLELSDADLGSLDTVQDYPEKFNQEFVSSSDGVYKEIYKVLSKHITHRGDTYGASRESEEYQYFDTTGVPRDIGHVAFAGLVDKLRDSLNGFISRVHSNIFNVHRTSFKIASTTGDSLREATQDVKDVLRLTGANPLLHMDNLDDIASSKLSPNGGNVLAYTILMGLGENDPDIGFVPGIDLVKAGVTGRINGYKSFAGQWPAGQIPYSTLLNIKPTSLSDMKKRLEAQYNANKVGQQISAGANQQLNAAIQNQQVSYNVFSTLNRVVGQLGANAYQNQVRGLMDQIIRYYLDLPEFQHIKVQMDSAGIGVGLMAYPDFKESLRSVANWVEGPSYKGNTSLVKYEPDCYLWYPSILGGAVSPDLGLIDPSYISKAKEHSIRFYEGARGNVNTFFNKRYLQLLGGGSNTQLVDDIKARWDKTQQDSEIKLMELYPPGQTIINASRNENPGKDKIAGPCVKVLNEGTPLLNAYPDPKNGGLTVRSPSIIGHVFDFGQHWGAYSVSQTTTPPPPETAIQGTPSALPSTPGQRKGKVFATRKGPNMTIAEFMAVNKITQCSPDEVEGKYKQLIASVAQIIDPKTGKPYGRHWGAGTLHSGWGGVSFDFGPPGFGQGGLKSLQMGPPTPEKQQYFYEIGTRAEALGFWWGGRWPYKFGNMENFRDWVSPNPISKTATKGTGKYKLLDTDGIGGMGDFMHVEWAPTKVGNARGGRTAAARRAPARQGTVATVLPTGTGNVAATMSSPIWASIREMQEEQLRGQGEGLMRAYPTFKLYFIEDDSKERLRFGLDDFFSYNAVQSIRVIRDRKIPADLCEIYLTNVSGLLSDRKYRQKEMEVKGNKVVDPGNKPTDDKGNIVSEPTNKPFLAGTKDENPIASLCLQEGMTIQLRLGYSSDPDLLDIVFNGVITNIEFSDSEDLVRIVAQSYAIELIQDLKGLTKPKKNSTHGLFGWTFWGLGCAASTGRLLENLIAEPEVLHFGRWKAESGGGTYGRELLTNRFTFWPQPADDNIFAPHPDDDQRLLSDGIIWTELKHVIYRSTIWDVFQEMTLRHPNFIASAVPYKDKYGPRMTMFFGLPNQLYFSRAPTAEEEKGDMKLQQGVKDTAQLDPSKSNQQKSRLEVLKDLAKFAIGKGKETLNINQPVAIQNATNNFFSPRLKNALDNGWIKPFRNYHLITSAKHIIANSINANSRDVANAITIQYTEKTTLKDLKKMANKINPLGQMISSTETEEETFTLKLDAALPPEETRVQLGKYTNVTNAGLAKRYALGLLLRNIRDIYRGEIIIVGNAKIKPYDVCYIIDEYSDMIGPIEVGAVTHVFDQQNGFRTEIKPDMLCAAAEWSLLSSAEALGVIAEGLWHNYIGGGHYENPNQTVRQNLSFETKMIGGGVSIFGGLMAHKILTYTQLSQPVVMSPLSHHGRVFAGGVPIRKLPLSLWNTLFGKWSPDNDAGFYNWIEDKKKEIMGKIGAYTGGYTQGDMGVWSSRPKGIGGI